MTKDEEWIEDNSLSNDTVRVKDIIAYLKERDAHRVCKNCVNPNCKLKDIEETFSTASGDFDTEVLDLRLYPSIQSCTDFKDKQ